MTLTTEGKLVKFVGVNTNQTQRAVCQDKITSNTAATNQRNHVRLSLEKVRAKEAMKLLFNKVVFIAAYYKELV